MKSRVIGAAVALCLTASVAAAQQPMSCDTGGRQMSDGRGMMMDSTMMARMESMTTRLDSLRRVMDGAAGARKTKAIAALLDAMVQHHVEMQRHMQHAMAGQMGGTAAPGCCKMGGAMSDSAAAGEQHQHQP